MSDLTIYAEHLISTVARAFYDDEVVFLIDVLIRDKFLRDDDMSPRLSMPAKKLRATLQFLQEEHLVRNETVDDLAQGGSQATKFYYLDYNRAVHSIRLRLYLLQKKLGQAELRARSSSFYLCPGWKERRCNGRYTEEEAQQVIDMASGRFLCQECFGIYENDPSKPNMDTYTLELVDNTKELKTAMDNLRRVKTQLSSKFIGNQQLRAGIYDLLQKVRGKGKAPITSNLPSENFALGIGSKRLAGTGRTAGIKEKKLLLQGVAQSAEAARNYLVGTGGATNNPNGTGNGGDAANAGSYMGEDLLFLKNAMGHEIQFTIERGGGARAQLLASKRRRRRKLMDAAASRVGASLPLYVRVAQELQRKRKAEQDAKADAQKDQTKKSKLIRVGDTLYFLKDNIGRAKFEDLDRTAAAAAALAAEEEEEEEKARLNGGGDIMDHNNNGDDGHNGEPELFLLDDDKEELRKLSDESRLAAFQAAYKLEMDRQEKLLCLEDSGVNTNANNNINNNNNDPMASPRSAGRLDEEELSVLWEDGWEAVN